MFAPVLCQVGNCRPYRFSGRMSGVKDRVVQVSSARSASMIRTICDSPDETQKLLNFVRGIRQAGKSAVFIDHNIFHVYAVADRVVVIDRGRVAGEFVTKEISLDN